MENKRVLSIQSHVVSGYAGNKSAVFPLQLLGFEVDFINSVHYSNHTGYGFLKGTEMNADDLKDVYLGLSNNNLNHYSHVLTGFIGTELFLREVSNVIKDLKKVNPELIYVCDPVMGDNGSMYVPKELLSIYKQLIVPLADIIVPNQYETELLTGIKIDDFTSAKKAMGKLHEMGAKTVVMSSSELGKNQDILVALASNCKNLVRVDIPKLPMEFIGTGDLFAAMFLAWSYTYVDDLKIVMETVISIVQAVLKRTFDFAQERKRVKKEITSFDVELKLIQSKEDIENPKIIVQAQNI